MEHYEKLLKELEDSERHLEKLKKDADVLEKKMNFWYKMLIGSLILLAISTIVQIIITTTS